MRPKLPSGRESSEYRLPNPLPSSISTSLQVKIVTYRFRRNERSFRVAGALTTVTVLCIGFGAFIGGNKVLAQNMMRARVVSQGATVGIMTYAASRAVGSSPELKPQ